MRTLHPRMFIAQSTLESWIDSGNAEVSETFVKMTRHDCSYRLEPAVRFLSAIPEDASPGVLGKVISEDRIEKLGGEILGDSVLFGEAAFQVEPGFIGTLEEHSAS